MTLMNTNKNEERTGAPPWEPQPSGEPQPNRKAVKVPQERYKAGNIYSKPYPLFGTV